MIDQHQSLFLYCCVYMLELRVHVVHLPPAQMEARQSCSLVNRERTTQFSFGESGTLLSLVDFPNFVFAFFEETFLAFLKFPKS